MTSFAHYTDRGPRSQNEDRVIDLQSSTFRLIGVADGLGGHLGGAEAAGIVATIALTCKEASASALAEVLKRAHDKIRSVQSQNEKLRSMGTTATIAAVSDLKLSGAHVGDTRCILQRKDGIIRLTQEHTEAFRLFKSGKLSKTEYENYPRRNILDNALGSQKAPYIDEFNYDLEPGDKIAIVSDGIHEILKLREMIPLFKSANNAQEIVENIISQVTARGPEDNFSIVTAVVG